MSRVNSGIIGSLKGALALSLLLAAAFAGSAAPAASASTTLYFPICTTDPFVSSTTYCLNWPGDGHDVVLLDAHFASYTQVYPESWVYQGVNHLVESFEVKGTTDCLTVNGSTGAIYLTYCNGRPSQEWLFEPVELDGPGFMINEYMNDPGRPGGAMCPEGLYNGAHVVNAIDCADLPEWQDPSKPNLP
jgi:hypothetical protein